MTSLLYSHGPTSSPKHFHPLADRGASLARGDIGRSPKSQKYSVDGIRLAFPVCISLRFPVVALKNPAVAPAEGLLIDAVLKHARIVLNRRP